MTEVILGLGSNIDERIFYIEKAIELLEKYQILSNIEISKLYESKAYLPDDAPPSWDKNFINMAVCGKTELNPSQLLQEIKNIEREIGRIDRGFWSPREIDIDILAYGEEIITLENLIIPHKYFLERPFALLPANDLRPNWQYPREGAFHKKTLKEIVSLAKIAMNDCWENKTHKIKNYG